MAYTDVMMLSGGLKSLVVDAAAATGTAKSQIFTVSPSPVSLRQVKLVASAVIATLTVDIEVSHNEGVTWLKDSTGYNFVALPTQAFSAAPGLLYRLNVMTYAGGPVSIYAYFG